MARFLPKSIVCLREGYDRATVLGDLVAGLTVGVIALPLAMAFAIASGLTPERGLYTAIVAGFVISALGGSRVQIGGPTGAFVVIVYSIVERHGYDGLVLATLMAGVIIIAMGLARMGAMIKFIPYPVTTGFTSGIALIIFTQQIKDFFGLQMAQVPPGFADKIGAYAQDASTWNGHAAGVGVLSLAVILGIRRFVPRVPGALCAVVLAALAVELFRLPVDTIGSRFGGVPNGLPAPSLPAIDLSKIRALIPEAMTIAMLGAIESLLSAVVADGMTGRRHKSDCELVAQGVANIGSMLFGGMPATGAIARTVANVKSGGRTPLAGMIHASVLLAIVLTAAPLAAAVPLPALAAILMFVAWNMAEIRHFRSILKAPRSDVLVLLTTFGLTVFVDLTVGVGVGLVLASLLFMKRMAEVSDISALVPGIVDDNGGEEDPMSLGTRKVPPDVDVFEMNGPFFFGVVDRLADVLARLGRNPRVFVLRMRRVPAIDATGLHALEDLVEKCRRHGTEILLSGVQRRVLRVLQQSGFAEHLGPERLLPDIDAALARAAELCRETPAAPADTSA